MAPTSLLSIVSLALLTLFASSLSTPVNAVSVQSEHIVRRHADISLSKRSKAKKRSNSKRCKAKSSSATPTPSSTKAKPASTKEATSPTTHAAAPAKTSQASSGSSSGSSGSSSGSSGSSSGSSGSSSSSSGGVNLRGKACLAWPNYNYNKLSTWQGSKTGMIYSWDATKVPGADELGLTYAPMLWGWKDVGNWASTVVEGYAKLALGCNEPNEVGQSNMDAWSGIDLWKQYMLPLADKGYTLISPAMSSRPNGKDWMDTFMKNCDNCKVGGIATHWYGTDLEEFKSYVTYWHDTYNLPVYVTEYADQDFNNGPQATMDEIWAFMTGATQWLDSLDWVHAHCWFGAMENMDNVNPLNKLMNDAGDGPNDLGSYFINN